MTLHPSVFPVRAASVLLSEARQARRLVDIRFASAEIHDSFYIHSYPASDLASLTEFHTIIFSIADTRK